MGFEKHSREEIREMLVERIVEAPLQLVIFWQEEKIVRVKIDWSPCVGDHSQIRKGLTRELAYLFCRYLQGKSVEWPRLPLAWERLSAFSQLVLRTLILRVPYGEWISYGELARLIAAPQAARAVGQVLGANPFPLFVPCHRVLRVDKGFGGYSGGVKMKQFLLYLEGIVDSAPLAADLCMPFVVGDRERVLLSDHQTGGHTSVRPAGEDGSN